MQELSSGLEDAPMTLPAQDIVERLKEAAEKATPGPWFEGDKWVFVSPLDPENNASSALRNILRDVPEDELQANCAYIALCSPDNIGALLDTISRLTADNEILTKHVAFLRDALGKDRKSIWRDAKLSASTEEAVEAILEWSADSARADALAQEVERLREERDELQAVFDLRWEADMRAISKWRDAGPGRELTLPDHVDLVIFLFEWVEELLGALEPFAKFAEKAERFVQGRADFGGSPIMPTKHFRLADFRRARAAFGDRP
jgi:hypothetical protein